MVRWVFVLSLCTAFGDGIRVSPKLDLEESNGGSGAALRPVAKTQYRIIKSNFNDNIAESSTNVVDVVCNGRNCNTAKAKSEGAVDVSVHISTGENKLENSQPRDIPVVVGTKSTTPQYGYPRPSTESDYWRPNYPSGDGTYRSDFPQSVPVYQNGHEVRSYGDGYIPSINNEVPTYVRSGSRVYHEENWNQKGVRGSYNPVEFRKTYGNVWTQGGWSNERRSGVPRWTPCMCQHQEGYYATPTISSPDGVGVGVSGKITPLT